MQPIDPSRIYQGGHNAGTAGAAGQEKIGPLGARDEGMAQQIAHYEQPPPSGFALSKPNSPAAMWLARANEISMEESGQPYDATSYGNKNKTVQAFGVGKQGDQVKFWNNAAQHFQTMDRLVDAMGNGDVQLLNAARNAFRTQFGYEAPTDLNAAKNVVGQEIVKAIVANGGGEREREAAGQALAAANSPAQLKGVLNVYRELGGAQLRDLKLQYENGTGFKTGPRAFEAKLVPEAQAELQKVLARADAANAPAAKEGERKQFKQGWGVFHNGQWVPEKP
jgi:hypothetical protein